LVTMSGSRSRGSPESTSSTTNGRVEENKVETTGNRFMQLLWPAELQLRIVSGQYFAVKLVRYAFGLWLPLLLSVNNGSTGGSLVAEVGGGAAMFDVCSIGGSIVLGAMCKSAGPKSLPYLVFGTTGTLATMLYLVPAFFGTASTAPGWSSYVLLLGLGLATGGAETLLGSISPIYYSQSSGKCSVASGVATVNGYGSLGTVAAALALPLMSEGGNPANLPQAFAHLAVICWATVAASGFQIFLQTSGST